VAPALAPGDLVKTLSHDQIELTVLSGHASLGVNRWSRRADSYRSGYVPALRRALADAPGTFLAAYSPR
jgi:hypothetical protein